MKKCRSRGRDMKKEDVRFLWNFLDGVGRTVTKKRCFGVSGLLSDIQPGSLNENELEIASPFGWRIRVGSQVEPERVLSLLSAIGKSPC